MTTMMSATQGLGENCHASFPQNRVRDFYCFLWTKYYLLQGRCVMVWNGNVSKCLIEILCKNLLFDSFVNFKIYWKLRVLPELDSRKIMRFSNEFFTKLTQRGLKLNFIFLELRTTHRACYSEGFCDDVANDYQECEECDDDYCNSSPAIFKGIVHIFLPVTLFWK